MRSLDAYSLVQRRHRRAGRLARQTAHRLGRGALGLGAALALLLVVGSLLLGLAYAGLTYDLPSLEAIPALLSPSSRAFLQPTRILDRSGEHVLRTLTAPGVQRRYMPLTDDQGEHLSASLVLITLAAANPRFASHPGFLLDTSLDEERRTLAQRLVFDLLLQNEPPGLRRDLRERLLAAQLTARFGREQVLEWYLNSAYYGHLAYGAEAAAQTYLGKPASQLNLAEAALLAAAAQTPALNPLDAPQAARQRQKELLDQLFGRGALNVDEYRQASESELVFRPAPAVPPEPARAFTNLVLAQLEGLLGISRLERGGLDIYTSLDYNLQLQAACATHTQVLRLEGQDAGNPAETSSENCQAALLLPTLLQDGAPIPEGLRASAVVLDPQTGQVLALVGETSIQGESAALLSHPSGTLLTPFIYLAGFTRGMGPASLVWDIPDPDAAAETSLLQSDYHGPLRLRAALANDYPEPAWRLFAQVGADHVWGLAAPFGIPTHDLAPGSQTYPAEVPLRLLEAAQAFGVFANQGTLAGQPVLASGQSAGLASAAVIKVADAGGQVLLDWSQPQSQLLAGPPLAYLVNSILSDETARWPSLGHPNPLEIGRPAGAKLGRSADGRGAWAVGYTPQRVVAVWMGLPDDAEVDSALDASLPAGLWHALMQSVARDLPPTSWPLPTGVVTRDVCDPSGLLPSAACPTVVSEIFLTGSEPTGADTLYRVFQVNRETGRLATVFTPPEVVESRVFMVVPPEAQAWAETAGVALPPDQYDSIQVQPPLADVRVDSPALFGVVKGEVTIRGTAGGEGFGFYRVQVGQGLNPQEWLQVGPDARSPVEDGELARWDASELSGLYAVRLLVVRQDQRVETATLQVTVDNDSPEVEISYPISGQVFDDPSLRTLTFQAQAADAIALERVEWLVDGKLVTTQVQAPFSYPWQAVKGKHTLQVRAYDKAGNLTETGEIDFEIK